MVDDKKEVINYKLLFIIINIITVLIKGLNNILEVCYDFELVNELRAAFLKTVDLLLVSNIYFLYYTYTFTCLI